MAWIVNWPKWADLEPKSSPMSFTKIVFSSNCYFQSMVQQLPELTDFDLFLSRYVNQEHLISYGPATVNSLNDTKLAESTLLNFGLSIGFQVLCIIIYWMSNRLPNNISFRLLQFEALANITRKGAQITRLVSAGCQQFLMFTFYPKVFLLNPQRFLKKVFLPYIWKHFIFQFHRTKTCET